MSVALLFLERDHRQKLGDETREDEEVGRISLGPRSANIFF